MRISLSPSMQLLFLSTLSGDIMPVTLRPYFIPSSEIECPPTSRAPASVTLSLPPCIIFPNIFISMLSGKHTMLRAVSGRPPIAYISERAFAAAI